MPTKKMKCDGDKPCKQCKESQIDCEYSEKKTFKKYSKTVLPRTITNRNEIHYSQIGFDYQLLKRISFKNNSFYEHISKTEQLFYGTQLPPLLFDFFNITCQPYPIWHTFIQLCRKCIHHMNNHNNNMNNNRATLYNLQPELCKQAILLFIKYNYLYGPLIDINRMDSFIQNSIPSISSLFTKKKPSMNNDHNTNINLLIVSSILALIFQSAHQSLQSYCSDLNPFFEEQSKLFYDHAHQLYMNITFSSSFKKKNHLNHHSLIDLTFISILLLHYQCVNIDEEQAYMTLQLGMGYARRCGVYDVTTNNNYNNNSDKEDENGDKQMNLIKKLLLGWQSWFAFYLQRDHLFQDTLMISCKKEINIKEENSSDENDNHIWAMKVLDAYTDFFWKIRLDDLKPNEIIYRLKSMEIWSATFNDSQLSNNKEDDKNLKHYTSANILSIYHYVLTIQILSCQQNMTRRNSNASQDDSSVGIISSNENNNISTPCSPVTSISGSLDQMMIKKEIMDSVDDMDDDSLFGLHIRSLLFIMNAIEKLNTEYTSLNNQPIVITNRDFIHPIIRHPLTIVTSLLSVLTNPISEIVASANNDYLKQKYLQEYITRVPFILQIISSPFNIVHSLLKPTYDMLTKLESLLDLQLIKNNDHQEETVAHFDDVSTSIPSNNITMESQLPNTNGLNDSESISPVVVPDFGQKRQMVFPTNIKKTHRPAIDQQQIDKLSRNKAMLSDPYSVRNNSNNNNANKRKSATGITVYNDHSALSMMKQQQQQQQQASFHKRQKSLPNNISYPLTLSSTNSQPQVVTSSSSTSLLPAISSSSAAAVSVTESSTSLLPTSNNSVISSRYIDQLNVLSDATIYTDDCLAAAAAESNVWMTIVENSNLATQPQIQHPPPGSSTPSSHQQHHVVSSSSPMSLSSSSSLSSYSMGFIGNNTNNTNENNNNNTNENSINNNTSSINHKSKLYNNADVPFDNNGFIPKKELRLLPQPKNNPVVPKTWSAARSPINIDWNSCFFAEVSQTLHTNSPQQFNLDTSYGTVDPIPINVAHPTPPNQEDTLYIYSANVQPSQNQQYHYNHHHATQHHHQQQQQQQMTPSTTSNPNWMTVESSEVASGYY
ncbi:unnamed protein product [Cunninghamella blakesleeana]